MNPQIYGWQHWLYLCFYITFILGSLLIIKKYVKSDYYSVIIKVFALINLTLVTWNRLSIYDYHLTIQLIPNSFCSTSGFVSALCLLFLRRDSKILHFALFAAAFGGLLGTVYPDFLSQNISFFYDRTISGLLYHSGMLYLFILTISLGYFKPNKKTGLCSL